MDDHTAGTWPGSEEEGVYAPPAAPGHSYGDGRGQQPQADEQLWGVDEHGNPVQLDQSQAEAMAALAAQFAAKGPQQQQQAPTPPIRPTAPPRASQAPTRPIPGQAPPPNIKTKSVNQPQTSAAEQPGAASYIKMKPSQRASTIAEAIKARQDAGGNQFELTHTMPGMMATVRYPNIVSMMTMPGIIQGELQVWVSQMLAEGVAATRNGQQVDGAGITAKALDTLGDEEQAQMFMELCQAVALVGFIDPPLVREPHQEAAGNMWVGRIDFMDLANFFMAVQQHQAQGAAAVAPFPDQAATVAAGPGR